MQMLEICWLVDTGQLALISTQYILELFDPILNLLHFNAIAHHCRASGDKIPILI